MKLIIFFIVGLFVFSAEGTLYHGSLKGEIKRLEPKLRYTPGEEVNSPAGIYASDLPAFAAAHSFPWSSDEGVDLYVEGRVVFLEIPISMLDRLSECVHIYVVDDESFSLVKCEMSGHTFRSTVAVDCLEEISFLSVTDAIEYFGGQVIVKKEKDLVSVGKNYIDVLNQIGADQSSFSEEDLLNLCDPACRKIVNGALWFEGMESFVPQLLTTKEKIGLWEIKTLDIIPAKDGKSVVLRFLVHTEAAGIWNTLVILRCNEDLLIEEINEIFNAYEGV